MDRRSWLRTGLIAAGAASIQLPIRATGSYKKGYTLHHSSNFKEFTAPKLPKLSTLKARLVWNENPYGPAPMAQTAFNERTAQGQYYSWDLLYELIDKIAEKEGVDASQIMMGPGSTDMLEKTSIALFYKGGHVISADPSYMSIVNVAKALGADWQSIPLTKDYQHDLTAMEAAITDETKLVYITNPNNPTGTTTDTELMLEVCGRIAERVPVFVDEAYLELCDEQMSASMLPLVKAGKDVIISRTFSKIHAMAGLRVGYMISNEKMIERVSSICRGGMGITGPSIVAASASLDDSEHIASCRQKLIDARQYTFDYLDKKGLDYMPSQTNFIIFPIEMDGNDFLEKIYEKQIAVRTFSFWDKTWVRVSMGTMENMEYFAKAVDQILV